MTTRGRIYGVDSHPTPPPTDDEVERAIDLIMVEKIRLAARVQQLETALDALLMAFDNEGSGLVEAVTEARRVRRQE